MRPEELDFIMSSAGRALIDDIAPESLSPAAQLATASRLRDRVAPTLATAVLEMALLRQRAAQNFSRLYKLLCFAHGFTSALF